jgi:hypothetical protein
VDRDSWYLAAADSSVLLRELLRQGTDLPPPSEGVAAAGDGLATWEGLMRAIGARGLGTKNGRVGGEGNMKGRLG